MKKVLVYLNEFDLAPKGGQLGYNYNLKEGLSQIDGDSNIRIDYIDTKNNDIVIRDKINNIKNKFLKKIVFTLKRTYKYFRFFYLPKKCKSRVSLDSYDAVHFHSTIDLFSARNSLKNYKGKVILTSHSPTLLSKETRDVLTWFEKIIFFWIFGGLKLIDKYSFKRADVIFFPCKDAIEPYYHSCKKFEKWICNKQIEYILTGSRNLDANVSREELLKKYNVPYDSFIVSFIGRHNKIKGYDRLKKWFVELQKNYHNVYFLIAGKEEPIKGIKNKKWIEIGWTKDPYSIIKASNLFILPNRETYFDLVLLEALSLGTPCLISNTGGNKHFSNYDNSNVMIFDDNNFYDKFKNAYNEYSPYSNIDFEKNIEIFNRNFSLKIFAENY